jgi:hypothetical protein
MQGCGGPLLTVVVLLIARMIVPTKMNFITEVSIFSIYVIGCNLLYGHLGMVSFGQPFYLSVGAYFFCGHIDPEKEVLILIGSKEGIAHLPLAFINPGDVSLVPSPGYPVYNIATLFCGGESYTMPLRREKGFLPDLDAIPADVVRRAKVIFINYPNNPTAAVVDKSFLKQVVLFLQLVVEVC